MAFPNGGFPPPVSQTRRVTRPDISGTQTGGRRLQGVVGGVVVVEWSWLHRLASQSISLCLLFKDFFPPSCINSDDSVGIKSVLGHILE